MTPGVAVSDIEKNIYTLSTTVTIAVEKSTSCKVSTFYIRDSYGKIPLTQGQPPIHYQTILLSASSTSFTLHCACDIISSELPYQHTPI